MTDPADLLFLAALRSRLLAEIATIEAHVGPSKPWCRDDRQRELRGLADYLRDAASDVGALIDRIENPEPVDPRLSAYDRNRERSEELEA